MILGRGGKKGAFTDPVKAAPLLFMPLLDQRMCFHALLASAVSRQQRREGLRGKYQEKWRSPRETEERASWNPVPSL